MSTKGHGRHNVPAISTIPKDPFSDKTFKDSERQLTNSSDCIKGWVCTKLFCSDGYNSSPLDLHDFVSQA